METRAKQVLVDRGSNPRGLRLGVGVLLCAWGCTPVVPVHLAETAATLRRGEVSFTGAAGAGDLINTSVDGVQLSDNVQLAADGRLRVGLGHHQEIGGEVLVDFNANSKGLDFEAFAGKLSWKGGPAPWIAFLLGAGLTYLNHDQAAVSGDLGFVCSPPERWPVVPYAGVRFSAAVPLRSDPLDGLGLAEVFTLPFGAAILRGPVGVYLEGGYLGILRQGYNYVGPRTRYDYTLSALYGLVGVSLTLGR